MNKITKNQSGFTLVELVVVLAIVGILLAYAVPSYRDFSIRQNVKNQVNSFITDLSFARITAINTSHQVVVEQKVGGWAKGWTIFIDENRNGSYSLSDNDVLLRDEDEINGYTTISVTGSANDKFVFNNLGASLAGPNSVEISHAEINGTSVIEIALSGSISTHSNF